jgi:hypothetical protein
MSTVVSGGVAKTYTLMIKIDEVSGDAVVRIASVDQSPAHLVLGSDALRLITAARTAVDEDIRAWETLSRTA